MNKPIYIVPKKSEGYKPFRASMKGALFIGIILIGMFVGGIIGLFIADFIMANNIYPYWHKIDISTENLEVEKILSVRNNNLFPNGADSSNDKLFIITINQELYQFGNNQWQSILPLPSDEKLEIVTIDYQGNLIIATTNDDTFVLDNNQWKIYEDDVMTSFLYLSNDCASKWNSLPKLEQSVISSTGISNPGHSIDR